MRRALEHHHRQLPGIRRSVIGWHDHQQVPIMISLLLSHFIGHKLRSGVSRSREQAFADYGAIVMVIAVAIAPKTGTGDRQIT
jgi:hypothetical protein